MRDRSNYSTRATPNCLGEIALAGPDSSTGNSNLVGSDDLLRSDHLLCFTHPFTGNTVLHETCIPVELNTPQSELHHHKLPTSGGSNASPACSSSANSKLPQSGFSGGIGQASSSRASSRQQLMERLLQVGLFDVNQTNNLEQTPLHLAARYGLLDIVICLCQHNAKLSATDSRGFTPLLFAAKYRHAHVVRFLVQVSGGAGGNIDATGLPSCSIPDDFDLNRIGTTDQFQPADTVVMLRTDAKDSLTSVTLNSNVGTTSVLTDTCGSSINTAKSTFPGVSKTGTLKALLDITFLCL